MLCLINRVPPNSITVQCTQRQYRFYYTTLLTRLYSLLDCPQWWCSGPPVITQTFLSLILQSWARDWLPNNATLYALSFLHCVLSNVCSKNLHLTFLQRVFSNLTVTHSPIMSPRLALKYCHPLCFVDDSNASENASTWIGKKLKSDMRAPLWLS